MASADTPADVAPETTEQKPGITRPQKIAMAVVGATLLWVWLGGSGDKTETTADADAVSGPELTIDVQKAAEAEDKDSEGNLKPLATGLVGGLDLDMDVNSQAAVAVLTKRQEQFRRELEDASKQIAALKADLEKKSEEQNRVLQTEISKLADHMLQRDYQVAVGPRDGDSPIPFPGEGSAPAPAGGIAFDDNPFSPTTPGVQGSAKPTVIESDDGRYMVLNNRAAPSQPADGKKGGSLSTSALGIDNPFTAEPPTKMKFGGAEVDLAEQQKPIKHGAMIEEDATADGDGEWLTIPAFSFVDTVLLHAVSCPVGGSLVGASSNIPPRPIVIPVRGIFKGPNGAAYDVGHVHFYGLCSARYDVKGYGRAEITIQKMSYWLNDQERTPIEIDATGYVVDSADNEIDVKGPVKSLERKYLLAETLGQGIAAYANVMKQQEFTNVVNDTGSVTSTLTGEAPAAAANSAIAGMMTTWADFMKRKAQAVVDTVYVNGGHSVKVITTQQLKIKRPAPPVDERVWKAYEELYL